MHHFFSKTIFLLLIIGGAFVLWLLLAGAGEEGEGLSDGGVEIEISPVPSPVSSPTPAPRLGDYCPPKEPLHHSNQQRPQAMGAAFSLLLYNNLGGIKGESFCLLSLEERYYVVLDFQEGMDPVGELHEWFMQNLGQYGYDVCSMMNKLYVIILQGGVEQSIILCPEEPKEQEEVPEDQGDRTFA
jgi:hypothetical protein